MPSKVRLGISIFCVASPRRLSVVEFLLRPRNGGSLNRFCEILALSNKRIASRLGALGGVVIMVVNTAYAMSFTIAANRLCFVALSRRNLLIPELVVFDRIP
jgi:hypothetical protein